MGRRSIRDKAKACGFRKKSWEWAWLSSDWSEAGMSRSGFQPASCGATWYSVREAGPGGRSPDLDRDGRARNLSGEHIIL